MSVRTFVLATVGTSLLQGLRRELGIGIDQRPGDKQALEALRRLGSKAKACGAEISSLTHLLAGQQLSNGTVTPPVEIRFLVSDTDDGRWVGQRLKEYFEHVRDVERVDWEVIEGLDGTNPEVFARRGLRSLAKLSAGHLSLVRKRPNAPQCVIDATGGYKAQISFAALIGQVLKVPVIYLFEQFAHCIELPPLPVDFDRGLWLEYYWIFRRLSDEGLLPAREVQSYQLDERLWSLLEHEDISGVDYVALSPLLELLHQGFELQAPDGLQEPTASDLDPKSKLAITQKETGHQPRGSNRVYQRLAQFPWVVRVENIRFQNTGARWRTKAGGVDAINEIMVVYGDGDKGLDIRLTTTCRTVAEREWCLEQLRQGIE